jgi:toxin ParE1/3/4
MAWSLAAPAKEELDDIWWYIAQDDVTAADKMISRLVARFDMLSRQPMIGEASPELAANMRNFPVRPYVNYYTVEDNEIAIIRVLHGSRDSRRLF